MVLHPKSELTLEDIEHVKTFVKSQLIQRAVTQGGGTVADYVVREIVPGDKDGSPADFVDLDMKTPTVANIQYWQLGAGDQTTDTLDNWLESQTIDDGKWLGITGMFDLCPQAALPLDAVGGAPMNTISRIMFKRGGSPIAYWGTEAIYAQQDAVVGFTDEPPFFDQNVTPQIQTVVSEDGIDKALGLRGYMVERTGTINPVDHMGRPVSGVLGGFEPVQEVPLAKIAAIKANVRAGLIEMALRDSVIQSPDEALVMEALVGDPSASGDVDIYLEESAHWSAAAGSMMWGIDATLLTTLALSNIIDSASSYNKLEDNIYVGIYGLTDNTNFPKLNAVQFKRSSTVLDFWHVQHMYAYENPAGVTERPIFFNQNDSLKIEIRLSDTVQDYFPVFKTMVLMNKSNRIGGA